VVLVEKRLSPPQASPSFTCESKRRLVGDNRQLVGVKNHGRQLGSRLNEGLRLSAAELKRAQLRIGKISALNHLLSSTGFRALNT